MVADELRDIVNSPSDGCPCVMSRVVQTEFLLSHLLFSSSDLLAGLWRLLALSQVLECSLPVLWWREGLDRSGILLEMSLDVLVLGLEMGIQFVLVSEVFGLVPLGRSLLLVLIAVF